MPLCKSPKLRSNERFLKSFVSATLVSFNFDMIFLSLSSLYLHNNSYDKELCYSVGNCTVYSHHQKIQTHFVLFLHGS